MFERLAQEKVTSFVSHAQMTKMNRIELHNQQLGGLKKLLDMWTNWLFKTAPATLRGQREMVKFYIGSSHAIRMVPHSLEIIQGGHCSRPGRPEKIRPKALMERIISGFWDQWTYHF